MLNRRTAGSLVRLLLVGVSAVLRYVGVGQDEGADDVGEGPYIVYVYRSKSTANVHAASCDYLGQHGGVSVATPPTGWYSDPFDTFVQAWAFARAQNKRVTHACRTCLPEHDDYRSVT